MKVFIITKEGVYRHEIMGIYTSFKQAENRAIECLKNEPDDYHEFQITKFALNLPFNNDGEEIKTIFMRNNKIFERPHRHSMIGSKKI